MVACCRNGVLFVIDVRRWLISVLSGVVVGSLMVVVCRALFCLLCDVRYFCGALCVCVG